MIIVLLMLTSALAGCTGTDTTDLEQQISDLQQSNDQLNETIYDMEISLQERNTEIATLNSNVAMLQSTMAVEEIYRDSLLVLLEDSNTSNDELVSMIEAANNTILVLQSDFVVQQNLIFTWMVRAINGDLPNINLSGADLSYANLHDANLSGADLSGANLNVVDLSYANLYGSDLRNANLSGANLYGSDLRNANLSGADLSSSELGNAALSGVYWNDTTCPDWTNSDDNGDTCEGHYYTGLSLWFD